MRKLLATLLFCASSLALAKGELSLRPQWSPDGEFAKYSLGLAVHQPLAFNLAAVSWLGGGVGGMRRSEDRFSWMKADLGVEGYFYGFTAGVNYTLEQDFPSKSVEQLVGLKGSIRLW